MRRESEKAIMKFLANSTILQNICQLKTQQWNSANFTLTVGVTRSVVAHSTWEGEDGRGEGKYDSSKFKWTVSRILSSHDPYRGPFKKKFLNFQKQMNGNFRKFFQYYVIFFRSFKVEKFYRILVRSIGRVQYPRNFRNFVTDYGRTVPLQKCLFGQRPTMGNSFIRAKLDRGKIMCIRKIRFFIGPFLLSVTRILKNVFVLRRLLCVLASDVTWHVTPRVIK